MKNFPTMLVYNILTGEGLGFVGNPYVISSIYYSKKSFTCVFIDNEIEYVQVNVHLKRSIKRNTYRLIVRVRFNNTKKQFPKIFNGRIYFYKFYYKKRYSHDEISRIGIIMNGPYWTKQNYKDLYYYKSYYTDDPNPISYKTIRYRVTDYPFTIFLKKRIERFRKHKNILNGMSTWLYKPNVGPGFWDCYNKFLKDCGSYEPFDLLNEINKAKSKLRNNDNRLLSYASVLEV